MSKSMSKRKTNKKGGVFMGMKNPFASAPKPVEINPIVEQPITNTGASTLWSGPIGTTRDNTTYASNSSFIPGKTNQQFVPNANEAQVVPQWKTDLSNRLKTKGLNSQPVPVKPKTGFFWGGKSKKNRKTRKNQKSKKNRKNKH